MESDEIEDLERQIQMLEQKKRDLKKKKLIKRVKDLENEVQEMELSGESDKDSLTNDMKLRKGKNRKYYKGSNDNLNQIMILKHKLETRTFAEIVFERLNFEIKKGR